MSTIAQRVLALSPADWQQVSLLLHIARTSHDVERIDVLHQGLDDWIRSREVLRESSRSTLDAVLALVPEWRRRRKAVKSHEPLIR